MVALLLVCFVGMVAATTSTVYTAANFNCTTYCDMALSVCVNNSVYSSYAFCMGTCAIFFNNATLKGSSAVSGTPPFLDLDTSGNTFSCRAYHIEAAMSTGLPATHCPHGGVASTQCLDTNVCDGYCALIMEACVNTGTRTSAGGDGAQWDSYDHCYAACQAGFVHEVTPNVLGLVSNAGDDLACRAYHTSVATVAPSHCQHGNAASATCASTAVAATALCEGFCDFVQTACSGYLPYTSVATCKTACATAAWPDATGAAPFPDLNSRTNTMGCRIYHVSVAVSASLQSLHCPHASNPSTQCVDVGTTTGATTATGMATTTGGTTTKSSASGVVPSLLVLAAAAMLA